MGWVIFPPPAPGEKGGESSHTPLLVFFSKNKNKKINSEVSVFSTHLVEQALNTKSRRVFLGLRLLGLFVPAVYFYTLQFLVMDFFVPMMGRVGNQLKKNFLFFFLLFLFLVFPLSPLSLSISWRKDLNSAQIEEMLSLSKNPFSLSLYLSLFIHIIQKKKIEFQLVW